MYIDPRRNKSMRAPAPKTSSVYNTINVSVQSSCRKTSKPIITIYMTR